MKHMLKYGLLFVALTMAPTLWAAKKKPAAAPTMDPKMEHMMQMSMPGPDHKVLDPLVGSWMCVVRGWMAPDSKVDESTGTSENTWQFGGRYLVQDFRGSWAGQLFEGKGYTGFNNITRQYESIWLDNFSTSMMQTTGSYDTATLTLKSEGHFSCPMTDEKEKWVRSEVKMTDHDHVTYTSYFKMPDGKEFKSMEILYTRVK